MESESPNINLEHETVQFEDFDLSDTEGNSAPVGNVKLCLIVDHKNRIVSKEISTDISKGESEVSFPQGAFNIFTSTNALDDTVLTSDEEIEVSEEVVLNNNFLTLQNLESTGVACVAACQQPEKSLSYSSTKFKDEYATDAEDISDDDGNEDYKLLIDKKHNMLCGTAAASVISAVSVSSSITPSKQPSITSLSFIDKYLQITSECESANQCNISDIDQFQSSQALLTCFENLDSKPFEDDETAIDEFSVGPLPPNYGHLPEDVCNLTEQYGKSQVLSLGHATNMQSRFHGMVRNEVDLPAEERKGSMTRDLMTEDEMLCFENEEVQLTKRTKKRKLKRMHAKSIRNASESLTDEEFFANENKEWTETDESGAMRQITQIKTETSIKLERDGEGLNLDEDDLASRTTATTTTRIVTTVTTDEDDVVADGQQVSSEDHDDIRHSVEVILNQFMGEDSQEPDVPTSQPE